MINTKKNKIFLILNCIFVFFLTCCSSPKKDIFKDSYWLMENFDEQGKNYYHLLSFEPNKIAKMQVSYFNSTDYILWTGTYKITSKKIVFDFTQCVRYENDVAVGKYPAGQIVKYFSGDYLYSVGLVGDEEKEYHLQLIRPENFFYAQNNDFFNNPMEEFIKIDIDKLKKEN